MIGVAWLMTARGDTASLKDQRAVLAAKALGQVPDLPAGQGLGCVQPARAVRARAFAGRAVVSAPAELQRQRVLARPGMTEQTLDLVLSRQLPDDQRRARADWIIPSHSLDAAAAAVDAICSEILSQRPHT